MILLYLKPLYHNWRTKSIPLLWFSLVDMRCLGTANTIHPEFLPLFFSEMYEKVHAIYILVDFYSFTETNVVIKWQPSSIQWPSSAWKIQFFQLRKVIHVPVSLGHELNCKLPSKYTEIWSWECKGFFPFSGEGGRQSNCLSEVLAENANLQVCGWGQSVQLQIWSQISPCPNFISGRGGGCPTRHSFMVRSQ